MCGIVGLARFAGEMPLHEAIGVMNRRLRHRGPDGGAEWVDTDARVALGHRRLAIIDLSDAAVQPMHSNDGRFVVSFNGEIYNFLELRRELEAFGVAFRSQSDTEVLVEAFAYWGVPTTLEKLDGMFAVGAWDRRERRLWLARDPFGEKPLYYSALDRGSIVFASELAAIEAAPSFRAEIDHEAVFDLLRFGRISAPLSIYRGVRKLEPGQWLSFDADGRSDSGFFFNVAAEIHSALSAPRLDPDEALEALDVALRAAVRTRMVSDVPIGAFLSAGIDSSLVVALMQGHGSRAVRTFTIGLRGEPDNEAPLARRTAALLNTDHTELEVTARDAADVAERISTIYDEPFADSSQIPTYLVAKLARSHVTVALSGDAGDELFGGYLRQLTAERNGRLLARVPHVARVVGGAGASFVARQLSSARTSARLRTAGLHALTAGELLSARDLGDEYRTLTSTWMRPEMVLLDKTQHPARRWPSVTSYRPAQATYIDTVSYLPDDILTKVDRATMSVALEARVPFLSRELLRVAWRTSPESRWSGQTGKAILRKLARRYLPDEITSRRKTGFSIPVDKWLRGEMRPWAESLLSITALRRTDIFDAAMVRSLWEDHLSGHARQHLLWPILVYQGFALERRTGRAREARS